MNTCPRHLEFNSHCPDCMGQNPSQWEIIQQADGSALIKHGPTIIGRIERDYVSEKFASNPTRRQSYRVQAITQKFDLENPGLDVSIGGMSSVALAPDDWHEVQGSGIYLPH